uniref:Large ribosomal subunit protein uL4m n=1 Tax=Pipistrellus kuhlii TaxID=59472 RepID=A0A7J7TAX2_PIPKU|nr:mitochondrial ribosomal protein L4 [Pipistrellus kuhlii]
MLRLVRAGARAWLPPTRCQRLSVLAEEAAQPPEKPEPVASPGPQAPVLRKCELPVPSHRRPVQAWVESLRGFEQERVGLAELHPDVFSTAPRLDILHQVAIWQKNFKRISYAKTKTRAEVGLGPHHAVTLRPSLNVHSMLKHQTLVLTLQTVAFLEEKLLWQDSRYSPLYPFRLPYCDFP